MKYPAMLGVFKLYDTSGLPLEMVVDRLVQKGARVDWPDFIDSARRHGWKDKTIRSRAVEAITEAIEFDTEYLSEFTKRLDIQLAKEVN